MSCDVIMSEIQFIQTIQCTVNHSSSGHCRGLMSFLFGFLCFLRIASFRLLVVLLIMLLLINAVLPFLITTCTFSYQDHCQVINVDCADLCLLFRASCWIWRCGWQFLCSASEAKGSSCQEMAPCWHKCCSHKIWSADFSIKHAHGWPGHLHRMPSHVVSHQQTDKGRGEWCM